MLPIEIPLRMPIVERTRDLESIPSHPQSFPLSLVVTPHRTSPATTQEKREVVALRFRLALLGALYPADRLELAAAPLRRRALWVRGVEFWNEM